VGKGKEPKENMGNKRLRVLATSFLPEYSQATDKRAKSRIVSAIISMIREACPEGGGFVKHIKNGRWYEVDDSIAREKVGYVFRDLLSDRRYRSSSKAKVARRQQELNRLQDTSIFEPEVVGVCSGKISPVKGETALAYHSVQRNNSC
jgi:hypothetical protein